MFYSFDTTITVKEKDRGKWWCDKDLVRVIELEANDLHEALEKYRRIVNDMEVVQISKNAMQKKENMFIDRRFGERSKQIGYVITGSTCFQRENGDLVNKFIDLWVEIRVITYPSFE